MFFLVPFPPASAGPLTVAFQGAATLAVTTATATITTAVTLGAEHSTRIVIVMLTIAELYQEPVITIGGVLATRIVTPAGDYDGSSGIRAIAAYARVPTGTSANVVITLPAADTFRGRMGVFTLINARDSAPSHVVFTGNSSSATVSAAVNVPEGGAVFAGIANGNFTDGSFTWTGVTEQWDVGNLGDYFTVSGAYQAGLAAQTGRTISATYSVSGGTRLGAILNVFSWR